MSFDLTLKERSNCLELNNYLEIKNYLNYIFTAKKEIYESQLLTKAEIDLKEQNSQ